MEVLGTLNQVEWVRNGDGSYTWSHTNATGAMQRAGRTLQQAIRALLANVLDENVCA